MKQLNRWVYAIVGVIVLLFAGLVYAWSVLSTPIAAEFTAWSKAQLSLTFTLVMILFCVGSYPEGVCYSILIMNCTTWLLDKYIRPTIYGAVKKEKKEAAK